MPDVGARRSDIHRWAARVSLGFAVSFLIILSVLHVLEPELTVGYLISEMERGRYGWLMSLAFLTLGISSATLYLTIRNAVAGVGQIAARWLCVIAIAYVGAAAFPPDSAAGFVTPAPVTPSLVAYVHGMCGIVVVLTSPITFTLVGRSLARDQRWRIVARRVEAISFLPWLGLVSFGAALVEFALTRPQSRAWLQAIVFVSVSNRVLIVTYCVWLIGISLSALHLQHASSSC
jgi:hypothetical protein